MEKSIYTEKHKKLCDLLIQGRKKAKLTQIQLAEKLDRQQSFVAKYERGERRLDIFELIAISKVIGIDVVSLVKKLQLTQNR